MSQLWQLLPVNNEDDIHFPFWIRTLDWVCNWLNCLKMFLHLNSNFKKNIFKFISFQLVILKLIKYLERFIAKVLRDTNSKKKMLLYFSLIFLETPFVEGGGGQPSTHCHVIIVQNECQCCHNARNDHGHPPVETVFDHQEMKNRSYRFNNISTHSICPFST